MTSNSGDGVSSGGEQGGSGSGELPPLRKIERGKFPFWARMFRYVIAAVVQFGYWSLLGLVTVVAVSWIVGFGETWRSLVGFASGVSWFFANVADVADVLFVIGSMFYLHWLATHREFLNPERDRVYTNPGVAKWKKLAWSLPVSVGVAVVLVASSVGFVGVSPWIVGAVYWGVAYYSARALTSTLREDAEWETWFGWQLPWKWTAWVSLTYAVYFAVEGGLKFLSPELSVAFVVATPLVGVAYLVRRALGVRGVVDTGRRMSAAALRRRMRGEDDVEEMGEEESKRRDGQSSEDSYSVSADGESDGFELGSDLDVVGGGDARWGYENSRDSASAGVASESVESSSEEGENTVEGGGSSDEREFDSWDDEGVDVGASEEDESEDDEWEYSVDDV